MPAPAAVSTGNDAPQVAAAIAVLAERAAQLHHGGGAGLLDCFAAIADPRSKRGVRHGLPTILGLCTAAVASGCVTLVEITDWVTHADQELLAGVGARQDRSGRHVPPHPDTIERVFLALGAQGLAEHTGAYLGRRAGIGPVALPWPARRCYRRWPSMARRSGARSGLTGRTRICWPRPPTATPR